MVERGGGGGGGGAGAGKRVQLGTPFLTQSDADAAYRVDARYVGGGGAPGGVSAGGGGGGGGSVAAETAAAASAALLARRANHLSSEALRECLQVGAACAPGGAGGGQHTIRRVGYHRGCTAVLAELTEKAPPKLPRGGGGGVTQSAQTIPCRETPPNSARVRRKLVASAGRMHGWQLSSTARGALDPALHASSGWSSRSSARTAWWTRSRHWSRRRAGDTPAGARWVTASFHPAQCLVL
jgi:hypothetical protein